MPTPIGSGDPDNPYPAGSIGAAVHDDLAAFAMFPDDIANSIATYLGSPTGIMMAGRMTSDASGYPDLVLNLTLNGARAAAAEYMAETSPNAWFLPALQASVPASMRA